MPARTIWPAARAARRPGYVAREWALPACCTPVLAYADEFIEIWFARGGLSLEPAQLDAGEFLDVLAVTPDELLTGCRDGVVTDNKTLTGLLWLQNVLAGAWSLDWQPAVHPPERMLATMKVFNLGRSNSHLFEGWFGSEDGPPVAARARPARGPSAAIRRSALPNLRAPGSTCARRKRRRCHVR